MKNDQLTYIEEPRLKFAYGQATEDSRDGLTLFGPYENTKGIIRVGVVGTKATIGLYSNFVAQMNKPIFTKSFGRPFYPGFKSVFGIEWPEDPALKLIIKQEDIDEKLAINNLRERTYQLVSLYLDAIMKCIEEEETAIDIWYILVPNTVLTLCRPKSYSGQASFDKKRIEEYSRGQIS